MARALLTTGFGRMRALRTWESGDWRPGQCLAGRPPALLGNRRRRPVSLERGAAG